MSYPKDDVPYFIVYCVNYNKNRFKLSKDRLIIFSNSTFKPQLSYH